MKWETVKLGEYCDITSSKRIFYSEYVDSGVPFYRSKEIIEKSQGQPISEPLFIRQEKYDEINEKFGVPQKGDLLLTSVGTIGIPYIVKDNDYFYFKDGNLTWFRNFDDRLTPEFLFYWIISNEGQGVLNNTTIGSSQKALTITALKNVEIPLPPNSIQNKIINILSAYSTLIENNQKQIKLLEEAAQRLYKEWFVDLRFPGFENTPVVDGVPDGWKKVCLKDICLLRKIALTPNEIPPRMPYIGLEHMPRKDICLCKWGESSEVNSNKFQYKERDILFGKIRPYFHKVGFAINDGIASTDCIIMYPKGQLWGLLLMTVSSDAFVSFTSQSCKEGAKMPRADWNEMKKYPVLVADTIVQAKFEELIENITNRIKLLAIQNRRLTEARDRLLPKLISGEVAQ